MILWTIIIIASVLLDQLTKWIVIRNMDLYQSIDVIDGLFSFTYIHNRGAAWGMFSDSRWVFIVATAAALIVLPIVLYKYRKLHLIFGLSLSFLIGGALGNMIDRVFNGYVVDFLEFTFIDFPVFNVADIFIVVGTAMMMIYILFIDKELFADRKKKASDPGDLTEQTETTDTKEQSNGADDSKL